MIRLRWHFFQVGRRGSCVVVGCVHLLGLIVTVVWYVTASAMGIKTFWVLADALGVRVVRSGIKKLIPAQ